MYILLEKMGDIMLPLVSDDCWISPEKRSLILFANIQLFLHLKSIENVS